MNARLARVGHYGKPAEVVAGGGVKARPKSYCSSPPEARGMQIVVQYPKRGSELTPIFLPKCPLKRRYSVQASTLGLIAETVAEAQHELWRPKIGLQGAAPFELRGKVRVADLAFGKE